MIRGILGIRTHDDRLAGFRDAIAAAPGIEFVTVQPANSERAMGMSVMENILTTHPDLKAVFATNDQMALGAVEAVAARNSPARWRWSGLTQPKKLSWRSKRAACRRCCDASRGYGPRRRGSSHQGGARGAGQQDHRHRRTFTPKKTPPSFCDSRASSREYLQELQRCSGSSGCVSRRPPRRSARCRRSERGRKVHPDEHRQRSADAGQWDHPLGWLSGPSPRLRQTGGHSESASSIRNLRSFRNSASEKTSSWAVTLRGIRDSSIGICLRHFRSRHRRYCWTQLGVPLDIPKYRCFKNSASRSSRWWRSPGARWHARPG